MEDDWDSGFAGGKRPLLENGCEGAVDIAAYESRREDRQGRVLDERGRVDDRRSSKKNTANIAFSVRPAGKKG